MLSAVRAAYNFLVVALAALAGASIALAFVLIVVDVSIRAFGRHPPAYTSAVVEYILLYFTLFAAPYLARQKGHVYVDALTSRLSGRTRKLVEKLAYLICVATSLVFAGIGFVLLVSALRAPAIDERSIDIASWVIYLPVGPVFLILAIEFGRFLLGFDTMYADRTKAQDSL
jgi:TRAP-type C4-dicarboxylate transport system permease small subunit